MQIFAIFPFEFDNLILLKYGFREQSEYCRLKCNNCQLFVDRFFMHLLFTMRPFAFKYKLLFTCFAKTTHCGFRRSISWLFPFLPTSLFTSWYSSVLCLSIVPSCWVVYCLFTLLSIILYFTSLVHIFLFIETYVSSHLLPKTL